MPSLTLQMYTKGVKKITILYCEGTALLLGGDFSTGVKPALQPNGFWDLGISQKSVTTIPVGFGKISRVPDGAKVFATKTGKKGIRGTKKPVLSWTERVKIALSAAEVLEFLHEKAEPPVIHGDIKSSNILLFDKDVTKIGDIDVYNEPPIDDPCLDRVYPIFSGYGAPEFESIMEFDTKTDIDSFGVVLLELLSGCKALDYTLPRGQQFLVPWSSKLIWKDKVQQCVDPRLKGDYPPTALTEMVALARCCVHPKAAHRPSMSIVVRDLRQCSAEASGVEASSYQPV